jgi:surface antigen
MYGSEADLSYCLFGRNFKMLKRIALVCVVALGVTSCQTAGSGQKQGAGTLLGGVAGAVAGAQFGKGGGRVAAGAAGALLGAFLGNQIGQSLDRADQLALQSSTNNALETKPSGTAVSWRNPDSGNFGSVTPEPAYKDNTGQYCREFTQSITVGSKTEEAFGTACRQVDGSWKIGR